MGACARACVCVWGGGQSKKPAQGVGRSTGITLQVLSKGNTASPA